MATNKSLGRMIPFQTFQIGNVQYEKKELLFLAFKETQN